jgi:hypothetical protein
LFIFLNKFFISLVKMSIFYKSYVDTNLASLHYIIFIEPFAVSSKEALSFDSEQFTNTSINKLIEAKDQDSYLLFEEHFFRGVLVYRTSIILFIFLNKFSISLVEMSIFYKSYVDTDLASLHYIIFIKSYAVSPKEALFFDSEQFTNISINKLIEAKDQDSYLLFEEHFFRGVLVYRTSIILFIFLTSSPYLWWK